MLKEQLIKSLGNLGKNSPYNAQVTLLVTDLEKKDVIISNDDYSNVIKFIECLFTHLPELFQNNSHDKELRALFLKCLSNLQTLAEVKSRRL